MQTRTSGSGVGDVADVLAVRRPGGRSFDRFVVRQTAHFRAVDAADIEIDLVVLAENQRDFLSVGRNSAAGVESGETGKAAVALRIQREFNQSRIGAPDIAVDNGASARNPERIKRESAVRSKAGDVRTVVIAHVDFLLELSGLRDEDDFGGTDSGNLVEELEQSVNRALGGRGNIGSRRGDRGDAHSRSVGKIQLNGIAGSGTGNNIVGNAVADDIEPAAVFKIAGKIAVEFLIALNAAEQERVVDCRLRTDGVVDDVGE